MKYIVKISQYIVGILFIISGLIKLNDPVGFSFKLEEYFSETVLNMPSFIPFALVIAVFVVIFEVVLGVALLLGFKPKLTNILLLILILGFTFLTFYSAYFNKVTDCGCFGDALKLTPWQSFTKDIILLVLIVILILGQKHIKSYLTQVNGAFALFLTYTICLFIGYYVLNHLPIIDFRAYKVGTNIEKAMEIPQGAKKDVFEMTFVYKVNGVETTFSYDDVMNSKIPADAEFVSSDSKLIEKGYVPPIHDFIIDKEGEDLTAEFLNAEKVILFIAYDLSKSKPEGLTVLNNFTKQAEAKGYKVIGMTASNAETIATFKAQYHFNFDFYFCDGTTLKTIERANPSIVVLKKGTIVDKKHFNDIEKIKL